MIREGLPGRHGQPVPPAPVDYFDDMGVGAPESLGDLAGPGRELALPRHVSRTPGGRTYDLGSDAQAAECYRLVLSQCEPAEICGYVNGGVLLRAWPRLRRILPAKVRDLWEGSFPELAALR